jgi:hypothetical protein
MRTHFTGNLRGSQKTIDKKLFLLPVSLCVKVVAKPHLRPASTLPSFLEIAKITTLLKQTN